MPFTHMAEKSDIVEIKKSNLKKAGKGLFVTKKLKKDDFIAWYTGVYIDKETVDRDYYDSDYLWAFEGSDLIVDAADPLSCFGRYANDSLNKGLTNARIVQYDDIHSGALLANKAIPKGSEVYITYGPEYWLEKRRFDKLNSEDKQFIKDASP